MFEALTQRLEAIFDRLRGAGRLTEENIQEALRASPGGSPAGGCPDRVFVAPLALPS